MFKSLRLNRVTSYKEVRRPADLMVDRFSRNRQIPLPSAMKGADRHWRDLGEASPARPELPTVAEAGVKGTMRRVVRAIRPGSR